MKIRNKKYIMLVEALIYMAVLLMVMALSYKAFYQSLKNTQSLRKAGDDIVKVSQIGDKWREDIRSAESIKYDDGVLAISGKEGKSFYSVQDGNLMRRTSEDGLWKPLYGRIAKCDFAESQQEGFTAWEMNVELKSDRKNAKVRPLFSFTAVNKGGGK